MKMKEEVGRGNIMCGAVQKSGSFRKSVLFIEENERKIQKD